MDENREGWSEIGRLIGKEKEWALAEFRSLGFPPAAAGVVRQRPRRLSVHRPAILAAAACLVLTVGVASLWLLRGGWKSSLTLPAWGGIFADSSLYSEAGRLDAGGPAAEMGVQASPYFTAWAEAVLGTQAGSKVSEGPEAASRKDVEHGDPEKLRRAIGRAIRENAFERILIHMQKLYAQEA